MKKIFLLCSLLLLSASTIMYGQDSIVAVSRNRYIQLDFGSGYSNINLGSVNNLLKSNGYKPLKENYPTLSLSGSFFINRFLFRSEYTLFLLRDIKQDNEVITGFGGHSLGFGIGYAIIQQPKFRLYPYAGINTFTTNLKFEDISSLSTMNDVINTPHRTSKIYFTDASVDLGLQAEKVIAVRNRAWDCPQNNRYITIGVRAGYNTGIGRAKGKYNGHQDIADAPTYKLQGPYVKLIFGMGTKLRELQWKR